MPEIRNDSTSPLPYTSCIAWPTMLVDVGVSATPATLVHCLTISPRLSGETYGSLEPWKSSTRGRWLVKPGSAMRTASPHCCAVFLSSGCEPICMQFIAPWTLVAQSYAMPDMIAPPLNLSGHVASITDTNAPPAENP